MNETITIALVDDNDIDLMIGERLISVVNPDINVETFSSGEALLLRLASKNHMCLAQKMIFFIDIYMPQMNGFEVVERAKKITQKNGCKVDFYLLSATIDDIDLKKIKKHPDVTGFIGKPITANVLDELVKAMTAV